MYLLQILILQKKYMIQIYSEFRVKNTTKIWKSFWEFFLFEENFDK